MKSELDLLIEISNKLDTIIKLISVASVASKGQTDAIRYLGQVGVDRHIIAEVVGTKAEVVSVRLSELKKKKGTKKKK